LGSFLFAPNILPNMSRDIDAFSMEAISRRLPPGIVVGIHNQREISQGLTEVQYEITVKSLTSIFTTFAPIIGPASFVICDGKNPNYTYYFYSKTGKAIGKTRNEAATWFASKGEEYAQVCDFEKARDFYNLACQACTGNFYDAKHYTALRNCMDIAAAATLLLAQERYREAEIKFDQALRSCTKLDLTHVLQCNRDRSRMLLAEQDKKKAEHFVGNTEQRARPETFAQAHNLFENENNAYSDDSNNLGNAPGARERIRVSLESSTVIQGNAMDGNGTSFGNETQAIPIKVDMIEECSDTSKMINELSALGQGMSSILKSFNGVTSSMYPAHMQNPMTPFNAPNTSNAGSASNTMVDMTEILKQYNVPLTKYP
jgi:hypothetical protein